MRKRGAKALVVASALITYAERSLRDLVRDHSGNGANSSDLDESDSDVKIRQMEILEAIVTLLPSEKAAFPINFLCCLLRSAIFLKASTNCKNELEKRISIILEHVSVDDLLVLSFTYDGERLFDLDSVRRIIAGFVEKEKNMAVFNSGDFREVCSAAMHRVAKTVDAYLSEIATYTELTISKFNGIANLVPKGARQVDDDLYRAIDIYLKVMNSINDVVLCSADECVTNCSVLMDNGFDGFFLQTHPNLDELEREKVCGVMDTMKLSYEARVHASQNKRLPVQIVLHALYYDQLKLRSGVEDRNMQEAVTTKKSQLQNDVSLVRENEALRLELTKMKLYISDLQRSTPDGTSATTSSKGGPRKPTFFSSMSKTLGKLNPFKNGSKDTSHIVDGVDVTKPRKRRFSMS